jgi:hypothetical protein
MKKINLSRRKMITSTGALLGGTGLYFSALQSLLASMVRGQIRDSRVRVLGLPLRIQKSRNYLQLNLYGAPSRWFFDHALRPNDSDAFLQGHGIFNRLKQVNRDTPHLSTGFYSDVKVGRWNMPHLWENDVAKRGGGSRPMRDLSRHMLTIRGCKMLNDGHPINCERQVCPIPGEASITGLVADATEAFFPAISVGKSPANKAFKSKSGVGVVDIPLEAPDYISYLLDVFQKKKEGSYRDLSAVDAEIENALGALQAFQSTNEPGAEILYKERRRAEKLIRLGVSNFTDAFGPLVKKYEDLFQRSTKMSALAGVNDALIPGLKFPCDIAGDVSLAAGLASHKYDNQVLCGADLRDIFSDVKSELAMHFALAEFAITEGLSSSILLTPPAHDRGTLLKNLKASSAYDLDQLERSFNPEKNATTFKVKTDAAITKFSNNAFITDAHEVGWISSLIGCNLFYRGLSACLLELIDRLQETSLGSGSLFDETVIHLATEFDRYPIDLGAGTQHNISANVTSLFSGIIPEQTMLGNIYVGRKAPKLEINAGGIQLTGTMGNAAPVPSLVNRIININNVSSTLSEMLRVPRIVPRAVPLVEVKGDKLLPTIESARNVEDEA